MSAALLNTGVRAQTVTPASPEAINVDVGSGSDRQVTVFLITNALMTGHISAFTVGTDSLSFLAGSRGTITGYFIEAWATTTALTVSGVQSVSVTYDNLPNVFTFIVVVASGSDLVNNGGFASESAASSPMSLLVTSATGDLSATAHLNTGTGAPTSSQTRFHGTAGLVTPVGADTKTTVSDVDPTHTWATGGLDWDRAFISAANFRATASAPPPTDFGGPASPWIKVRLRDY